MNGLAARSTMRRARGARPVGHDWAGATSCAPPARRWLVNDGEPGANATGKMPVVPVWGIII